MPRRARWWIILFCALLPATVPVGLILRFGTDFPFWDEWDPDIAGIHVKAHQHQLTFADLAAQHNEHRILIPRIAYLVVGRITSNNMIAMMLCGWFAACLTAAGILRLLLRTFPGTPLGIACAWLLCNAIVFTPQQWQSWLWGMGLGNLLPAMFVVWAIVLAIEPVRAWVKLCLMILLCFASTYTVGNGVVAWPLAGAMLLWGKSLTEVKKQLWQVVILGIAFVAAVGLYFIGYETPSHAVEESRAGQVQMSFIFFTRFVLAFIGNGFATATPFDSLTAATVAGAMIVSLLVGCAGYVGHRMWRGDVELADRTIVWFALAGYTIANAILAASTRAKFGVPQAVTPRYISFGLYAEMALVPLFLIVGKDLIRRAGAARAWNVAPIGAAAVVLLPPIFSWAPTLQGCRTWQSFVESSRGVMMLARIIPHNPQLTSKINPKASEAVANALVLDEIGYLRPTMLRSANVAAIVAPPEAGSPVGAFEKLWRVEGSHLGASGWAIHPAHADRAETILITCSDAAGNSIVFATAFQDASPRIDIAQHYKREEYGLCGWLIEFDSTRLPTTLAQPTLAAWVLDSRTGKAYRIAGEVVINR